MNGRLGQLTEGCQGSINLLRGIAAAIRGLATGQETGSAVEGKLRCVSQFFEPFLKEGFRSRQISAIDETLGQCAGSFATDGWVLNLAGKLVRLVEHAQRFVVLIFRGILRADGEKQVHVIARAVVVLVFDDVLFLPDEVIRFERFALRSRVAEQKFIDVVEPFGAGELVERDVALRARGQHLSPDASDAGNYCDDRKAGKRHHGPIPADELASAIRPGVWPGTDGLVFQVTAQIIGKGRDGRVALRGRFLERFGDYGVEVTAQETAKLFWSRASLRGVSCSESRLGFGRGDD